MPKASRNNRLPAPAGPVVPQKMPVYNQMPVHPGMHPEIHPVQGVHSGQLQCMYGPSSMYYVSPLQHQQHQQSAPYIETALAGKVPVKKKPKSSPAQQHQQRQQHQQHQQRHQHQQHQQQQVQPTTVKVHRPKAQRPPVPATPVPVQRPKAQRSPIPAMTVPAQSLKMQRPASPVQVPATTGLAKPPTSEGRPPTLNDVMDSFDPTHVTVGTYGHSYKLIATDYGVIHFAGKSAILHTYRDPATSILFTSCHNLYRPFRGVKVEGVPHILLSRIMHNSWPMAVNGMEPRMITPDRLADLLPINIPKVLWEYSTTLGACMCNHYNYIPVLQYRRLTTELFARAVYLTKEDAQLQLRKIKYLTGKMSRVQEGLYFISLDLQRCFSQTVLPAVDMLVPLCELKTVPVTMIEYKAVHESRVIEYVTKVATGMNQSYIGAFKEFIQSAKCFYTGTEIKDKQISIRLSEISTYLGHKNPPLKQTMTDDCPIHYWVAPNKEPLKRMHDPQYSTNTTVMFLTDLQKLLYYDEFKGLRKTVLARLKQPPSDDESELEGSVRSRSYRSRSSRSRASSRSSSEESGSSGSESEEDDHPGEVESDAEEDQGTGQKERSPREDCHDKFRRERHLLVKHARYDVDDQGNHLGHAELLPQNIYRDKVRKERELSAKRASYDDEYQGDRTRPTDPSPQNVYRDKVRQERQLSAKHAKHDVEEQGNHTRQAKPSPRKDQTIYRDRVRKERQLSAKHAQSDVEDQGDHTRHDDPSPREDRKVYRDRGRKERQLSAKRARSPNVEDVTPLKKVRHCLLEAEISQIVGEPLDYQTNRDKRIKKLIQSFKRDNDRADRELTEAYKREADDGDLTDSSERDAVDDNINVVDDSDEYENDDVFEQAPNDSLVPKQAAKLDDPDKPEDPEELEEPEEPESPKGAEESETQKDSEEPEDLEEPEESENPKDSEEPERSKYSEKPKSTEKPENTEEPEDSDEPEHTEEPEDFDEPENTEEPEDGDDPENPEEPEEPVKAIKLESFTPLAHSETGDDESMVAEPVTPMAAAYVTPMNTESVVPIEYATPAEPGTPTRMTAEPMAPAESVSPTKVADQVAKLATMASRESSAKREDDEYRVKQYDNHQDDASKHKPEVNDKRRDDRFTTGSKITKRRVSNNTRRERFGYDLNTFLKSTQQQ